ncbi:MAG: transglycosylase SLT domain-containing protein [Acidimicrobiales bacterium]|nr:transglycosylase SLT domain-containing protein [Acidimicrobiales bacterium]
MFEGRAQAGDSTPGAPLAAQPRVVRAFSRLTLVVGAAGVIAAGVGHLGGPGTAPPPEVAVAAGQVPGIVAVRATLVDPASGSAPIGSLAAAAVPADVTAVEAPAVAPTAAPVAPVPAPVVAAPPSPPPTSAPPPPPARPADTAVPASTPPSYDPASVEAAIVEVFGEHAEAAIAVARCESGLNPGAISRGGGNWGLFQINQVHHRRVAAMGYAWEDMLDPTVNSLVARSIFEEQGWQPWACRYAA